MLARAGSKIKFGDTIIVYIGFNDLRPLVVAPGKVLACKEGRFQHNDMVGKQLGTRVAGKANARDDPQTPHLLLLPVTPELWTRAVTHRTQIIYATDIAVIITCLRLVPGAIVAEAGTGSGSLTHSLARAVAPHGMVHTFDFHKFRAMEAAAEFEAHGLAGVITSHWADVCTAGPDALATAGEAVDPAQLEEARALAARPLAELEAPLVGYGLRAQSVNAVFLDVPAPWNAVRNVLHVLAPNGMVCSFSPCIEQTQRFCEAIRASDAFIDVRTVEALAHEYVPVFSTEGERRTAPARSGGDRVGDKRRRRDEAVEDEAAAAANGAASGRTPLHFKPQHMMKSHTALLTFARRKLPPVADATTAPKEE